MCQQIKPKRNIHGITSFILFFIAIGLGIFIVSKYSIAIALLNAIAVILAVMSITYFYCSKCPIRKNCMHYLFGKISIMIAKYKNEKYTTAELVFGTLLPLLIIIALPQYWLFQVPTFMAIYWSLLALAGLEISNYVCAQCGNTKCKFCKFNE